MNKNFHNSRGSSTHLGNQIPRWRIVFIALMLALAVGSVGQTPSAQADTRAQAGFGYNLRAWKLRGDTMICVGDRVEINVQVTRGFENQQNIQAVPGVPVHASTSNASIGQLDQVDANTGYIRDLPGVIKFNFTANKAGTTTITFEGTITTTFLGITIGTVKRSDQVQLTVEDCQYRVSAVSDFSPGPGALVGGVFKDAVMSLGSNGLFTGTATVKWFGYLAPTLCVNTHYLDQATTEARLTGWIDTQGRFHFNIIYEPGESTWRATCKADFVDTAKLNPFDLKFEIPSYGAVGIKRYHAIEFSEGTTTVTVIQEKSGGQ